MTFGCKITDADMMRAFAPEQPAEVVPRQHWMRCEDGQVLPVWRVRHDSPLTSGGPRIDLGHDRLVIGMGEEQLRREWVCVDPPENVTQLAPGGLREPREGEPTREQLERDNEAVARQRDDLYDRLHRIYHCALSDADLQGMAVRDFLLREAGAAELPGGIIGLVPEPEGGLRVPREQPEPEA